MSTICMNPFTLSEINGGHTVPCGKCYNCKRRRTSSWSVRLLEQDKVSISALFVTLTYDTSHVPITERGYMSLSRRGSIKNDDSTGHLQKFFKKLRKWHPKEHPSIKYYAVGEYGGKTLRPHYHIILFNANIENIEKAWSFGSIHYGKVSEASVGYSLKYICKDSKIPLHKNDDRIPEYSLMSKGLGLSYLTKNKIQWHKENVENRCYIPLPDGKKAPLPRYFKEKIYNESDKEKMSYQMKLKSDLLKSKQLQEYGDNYQSIKEQQFLNGERLKKTNIAQKI